MTAIYRGMYYTVCFESKYVMNSFSTVNSCMGSFQMHFIMQNIYMYIYLHLENGS